MDFSDPPGRQRLPSEPALPPHEDGYAPYDEYAPYEQIASVSTMAAEHGTTPNVPTRGPNRRRFLVAGGAAAGLAAAAGFGGEYLQDKRFAHHTSATPAASPPAVKIGGPGITEKPLPKGADITDIPGLSSFYTPDSQFYRVDTALTVPKLSAQNWQLRIHGMVDRPITISFADLIKRPMIDHDITLTCVADSVGRGLVGNARWQGVLLADVLREAGIHPAATQIVMRDVNGMNLGVATHPVMDGRTSLLAIGMNGQTLPAEHGFPVRVVVPGLYGYVSACKWVVDMELTTFKAFDSYYTRRGWAEQAPIKTESRLDTPKDGSNLAAGRVMIAGVAWAQHRGIEAVEVGIDGTWHQATLSVLDVLDTWRQWYYPWQATPGKHTLQVRATDRSGHTQTAVVHGTFPSGATGYHTIHVTVA
jgi:DMSO/TMAO reductase YedYZ molybdopterin-dependent catalytic subunit